MPDIAGSDILADAVSVLALPRAQPEHTQWPGFPGDPPV